MEARVVGLRMHAACMDGCSLTTVQDFLITAWHLAALKFPATCLQGTELPAKQHGYFPGAGVGAAAVGAGP